MPAITDFVEKAKTEAPAEWEESNGSWFPPQNLWKDSLNEVDAGRGIHRAKNPKLPSCSITTRFPETDPKQSLKESLM